MTKSFSWAFSGFESPNAAPLAITGAPWQWAATSSTGAGWRDAAPYARHDVVVVDLAPSITAQRLEALLTPLPEAVVLRAFGVGNMPSQEPGLTDVVTGLPRRAACRSLPARAGPRRLSARPEVR